MRNKENQYNAYRMPQKSHLSAAYNAPARTKDEADWLKAFSPASEDLPHHQSYLTPRDTFQARLPQMDKAIALLKRYSPTGRALIKWAEDHKIIFAEKDMAPMGLWSRSEQCVTISSKCTKDLATSVIGHEIFHAVQQNIHGFTTSKAEWNFQTELFQTIAGEAGAYATQCRIAYEMKLAGYDGAWDALNDINQPKNEHTPLMQKYIPVAQAFAAGFEDSIKKGMTEEVALRQGVTAAQEAYVQSDEIKQAYAIFKLNFYFNDIVRGQKDMPAEHQISQNRVSGAYLNEKGHFIAQSIKHPKTELSLFGHDVDLMHLAQHIENLRHEQAGNPHKTKAAHFPSNSQIIHYTGKAPNPYQHITLEVLKQARASCTHKSLPKLAKTLKKFFKAP